MKTKKPTRQNLHKAGQGQDSNPGFEHPAPQPKAYWTLWRREDDSEIRREWDIPPRQHPPLAHEGLCACAFDSPTKLLADLLGKGWKKNSFDGTANRFALIEPTAKGITVTSFETYRAACQAHALSEK